VAATILVATEAHFVRGSDGRVYSSSGVDGYAFWSRYRTAFDRVLVAARTAGAAVEGDRVVLEGPGVEVVPLPDYLGPWQCLRVAAHLRSAMAAAVGQADALCLRAPGPIAGLAWRLAGRRPYAVEVVGDPHDALAPGTVSSPVRPLARGALVHDLRRMCAGAAAVSYVTAGALQQRYPTTAWSTSYSSIDLDDGAFATPAAVSAHYAAVHTARRGTRARPWQLVFVGSLAQRYKAADVVIDAAARCRERGLALDVTIVGDGAERPGLEAHARLRGLGGGIAFLGHLHGPAAVRHVLAHSDVFVLPSRSEGLPRAMIEAMAMGLVCVGSRVGGVAELLDDGMLVPAGDATALADRLGRLLASPERLLPIALDNLERARSHHRDVLDARRSELYARLRGAIARPAVSVGWR
jgi:glycosyltransferase involved in cell wall biosynthesis